MFNKQLRESFLITRFRVYAPDQTLEIPAKGHSPQLAELLKSHNANWAALITAWNPQSTPTDEAINIANQQRLIARVSEEYKYFPADGRAPDGSWPVEPSLFVLGIQPETARALGREFGQCAILVVHSIGAKIHLVSCKPKTGPVFVFNDSISLLNDGRLFVRNSPGAYWYQREINGNYSYTSFILGGSTCGDITPAKIAQDIFRETVPPFNSPKAKKLSQFLAALGWEEVRHAYEVVLNEDMMHKRKQRIQELRTRIESLANDWRDHKDKNVQWWFGRLYEKFSSEPGFDPDDWSPIRHKWAAESAYCAIRDYPKMLKELSKLEAEEAKGLRNC